jgi:hypothetical protein
MTGSADSEFMEEYETWLNSADVRWAAGAGCDISA